MSTDAIFNDLEQESEHLTSLYSDISILSSSIDGIRAYGLTPAALHIVKTSGALYNSTAFNAIATEALNNSFNNSKENVIALESMLESLQEKYKNYSAKILKLVSEGGAKLWSVIEKIGDKIKLAITKTATSLGDSASSGVRAVRAHPVKTCLMVLGAVASVATIMIYSASNLPGAGQSRAVYKAFSSKINAMISQIKMPFGKVAVQADDARRFRVDVVFPSRSAEAIPVEKLGWNYKAAKAIGVQVDKILSTIKSALGTFGSKLVSATRTGATAMFGQIQKARKAIPNAVYDMTGSQEAAHATSFALGGIFFFTIVSLCWKIWRLIKKLVFGGLNLILSSLRALF